MGKREKQRTFRMKRFEVDHGRSANKVGVDGVLIGAWASVPQSSGALLLDAGCGCGLIALMLAQRSAGSLVEGVEIDPEAASEAADNVARSPWSDRIRIICADFSQLLQSAAGAGECDPCRRYDAIVSNPPFFHAGVDAPTSARELARHAVSLSPESLIAAAHGLLRSGGTLSYICQSGSEGELIRLGEEAGLALKRITFVKGNPGAAPKRVMMEWERGGEEKGRGERDRDVDSGSRRDGIREAEILVIEHSPGIFTQEYVDLCRDFYLNM